MKSFLKSFAWLTLGALLAKILGGFYKIILTNIIGGENIGIYQQLFPVFNFLVILSTTGVPLGISKMIAKAKEDEKSSVYKTTLIVFIIYSTLLALILILFSGIIAKTQGTSVYKNAYYILAPAIIFSSITAVLKGYFQSKEDFKPTAISNIVEQLIKIGVSVVLILVFANGNSYLQIMFAIVGILIGELFGCFIILIFKRKYKSKEKATFKKKYLDEICKNVLPIMLASVVIPLSQLIDSFLVVRLLSINFTQFESVYLYGLQTGVVGALINVPTIISFSMISVLLPSLSRDFSAKNEEGFLKKFKLSLKVILFFAIPCALFVLVYPKNLTMLLYGTKLNGFNMDGQMIASKLLFWSALNILFLCLSQFFSMCLQARESRTTPVINNIIGMAVKLVLEIVFIPSAKLNILSFTLANLIGYLTICVLNVYALSRKMNIVLDKIIPLKIILASALTLAVSLSLGLIGLNNINFVLISMLSILIYFVLIWKMKIFSKKEIKLLIKSRKND